MKFKRIVVFVIALMLSFGIVASLPSEAATKGATVKFSKSKVKVKASKGDQKKDNGSFIVTYNVGNDTAYVVVTMKKGKSKLKKSKVNITSGTKTFKAFDYKSYEKTGKKGDYSSRYALIKAANGLHNDNLKAFISKSSQCDTIVFVNSAGYIAQTIEQSTNTGMMFNIDPQNVNDDDMAKINQSLQNIVNLNTSTTAKEGSYYNKKSSKANNPFGVKNSSLSQTITASAVKNSITGADLFTASVQISGKQTINIALNFMAQLNTTAKNETTCKSKESADAFFKSMNVKNEKKKVVLARNKNNHKNKVVIDNHGNCEKGGKKTVKCKDCGYVFEETNYPISAHVWDDGVVVQEATCTADGKVKQTCKVCGHVQTNKIPKLGHDYADAVITLEPTCEKAGKREAICRRCKDSVSENIPKLGHLDDGNVVVGKEATCTSSGFECSHCSRCQKELNKRTIHSLGHEDDGKVVVGKEPTCTSSGYECSHCVRCQKEFNKKKLDKLGHNDDGNYVVVKEATCTSSGRSATHCTRCGKEMSHRTEPKLEHDWDDGEVEKAATSTSTGKRKFTCKTCHKTKTETIPKNSSDQKTAQNKKNEKTKTEAKKIKTKKAAIKKVTSKNNKFTIKLKKLNGISGYEIRVTGPGVSITKDTSKSTTQNIRVNATKGKKYKVKARAYKFVNGRRVYGKWSKTKKVKAK